MWCFVSVLCVCLAFCAGQDINFDDMDLFDDEPPQLETELINGLLDHLLAELIGQLPKKVRVHSPRAPIVQKPLLMRARSGVFEDLHSIQRSGEITIYDEYEKMIKMNATVTFGTFLVTFDGFFCNTRNFKTEAKIVMSIPDNNVHLSIGAGDEDECSLTTNVIHFTDMNNVSLDFYSDLSNGKYCDPSMNIFRAFFSRIFVNSIKPSIEKGLRDYLEKLIRSAETKICSFKPPTQLDNNY